MEFNRNKINLPILPSKAAGQHLSAMGGTSVRGIILVPWFHQSATVGVNAGLLELNFLRYQISSALAERLVF